MDQITVNLNGNDVQVLLGAIRELTVSSDERNAQLDRLNTTMSDILSELKDLSK